MLSSIVKLEFNTLLLKKLQIQHFYFNPVTTGKCVVFEI